MKQLEGFYRKKSLYINMGYCTIRIYLASQDMTMIVTKFGKFRYNRFPMGMCASGDIFRDKVDELLSDNKDVKTYIYDILVFSMDSFEIHIDQLRIISGRLRTSGLKVNENKCSFGLKEIIYLGYVITREGIKPNPKKVQGIMDLVRTDTTTEARELVGMVQYYMDIWTRRSHVLDTLTEVASVPKGRKHCGMTR